VDLFAHLGVRVGAVDGQLDLLDLGAPASSMWKLAVARRVSGAGLSGVDTRPTV
jgi:hypothetical protein